MQDTISVTARKVSTFKVKNDSFKKKKD
jgi:hypothetical protein